MAFDWDRFLGGVSATAIPAFQAVSNSTLGAREMQARELRNAIDIGRSVPFAPMPQMGIGGGVAQSQLLGQAGEPASNYGGSVGAIGAAPEPQQGLGLSNAQSRTQARGQFAFNPGVAEEISRLPAEQQAAFQSQIEQRMNDQKQNEIMDWMFDYDDVLEKATGVDMTLKEQEKKIRTLESYLKAFGAISNGLSTVRDGNAPLPEQFATQLQQMGVRVTPGMTIGQAYTLMQESADVMGEALTTMRDSQVKKAQERKFFEPQLQRYESVLRDQYGIDEPLLKAYRENWTLHGSGGGWLGNAMIQRGMGNVMPRFGKPRKRKMPSGSQDPQSYKGK